MNVRSPKVHKTTRGWHMCLNQTKPKFTNGNPECIIDINNSNWYNFLILVCNSKHISRTSPILRSHIMHDENHNLWCLLRYYVPTLCIVSSKEKWWYTLYDIICPCYEYPILHSLRYCVPTLCIILTMQSIYIIPYESNNILFHLNIKKLFE